MYSSFVIFKCYVSLLFSFHTRIHTTEVLLSRHTCSIVPYTNTFWLFFKSLIIIALKLLYPIFYALIIGEQSKANKDKSQVEGVPNDNGRNGGGGRRAAAAGGKTSTSSQIKGNDET